MFDDLRLASLGAFVATGLTLVSFLLLGAVCYYAVQAGELGARVPLIYILGTVAGVTLFHARSEYRNLRELRSA
jgi:hypothetical protein